MAPYQERSGWRGGNLRGIILSKGLSVKKDKEINIIQGVGRAGYIMQ